MCESNLNYGDEFDFCRPYLVNGEYVMWQGKPQKRRKITAADIYMFVFSLFWCGFAFFWEITAISNGAPLFFCLFGLLFMCVGLYLVFGRFIHISYLRKHTAYVITNKKIIRKRGKKIDMLDGRAMPPMFVDINENGNGTIKFGQETVYHRGYGRTTVNNSGYSSVFALENIPDVIQVQQIINNIER